MNMQTHLDLYTKTCCGIVLYNPEIDLLKKNIDALYPQVSTILLVDNHSDNINDVLELVSGYDAEIKMIFNPENYGIARALNQILEYAVSNSFEWYLTMDQDSIVSDNLIAEYSKYCDDDSVAVLCPYILNNNKITLDEYNELKFKNTEEISDPIDCITSGSLNRVSYALNINGYTNQLFIDSVDVDFNIRIFASGKKICRVNYSYLIQEMGKGRPLPLFSSLYKLTKINAFKRLSVSPEYSDFRLYHIFRNSKYLHEKYGDKAGKRMSDSWMFGQAIYYCLTYPCDRNRVKMIKAIFKGRKDSFKLGEMC